MGCDSYVQSKGAAAFFKVQRLIPGITGFWYIITDQQEVGFRFYYVGAKRKISTLFRYFRFKMASFSISRLWSDSLNLL